MSRIQEMRWKGEFVSFIAVISFCVLGYYHFDIPTAYFCKSLHPSITAFFQVITLLGISTWYLVASFAGIFFFKYFIRNKEHYKKSLFIFCALATSGLLNTLVKRVAGRYRPRLLFSQNLYGFDFFHTKYEMTSFPSGHANTITAAMLALSLSFPKYRYLFLIIALLVVSSRVIIAAHFLSDVVFGSYLAIMTTLFVERLLDDKIISG